MFDNLLGDLDGHQEKILEKLKAVNIEVKLEGIIVAGDANKTIKSIQVEETLLKDKEMLEDLLIAACNKYIAKADEDCARITEEMMKEMLPPGFEDLFNGK
jgi:hypothetical protein